MTYLIIWSDKSRDDLAALDKAVSARIISKVESIKENPFYFVGQLSGAPLYSLRVGEYRLILDIKKHKMVIFVVKVGHRRNVYDEL